MKLAALLGLLIVPSIRAKANLPYRFLLVVSDQWKDPSSTIIEGGDEYLSRDLVIDLKPVLPRESWAYDQKFDRTTVKWTPEAPLYLVFHDRDLSMDTASVVRLLDALGDVRYMSANEYSAYLHAGVEVETDASGLPAFKLHYDDHYCRRFADAPSKRTLHLSDAVRASAGVAAEKQQILVPKGTGVHRAAIRNGGITVR